MVTEQRPPSRTKAVVVYEAVRAAIASGVFGPGTRLRQEEVAARYGVSQTPVREAFRRLEAEGLVEHEANRGVVVREVAERRQPPPMEMLARRWSELVDDPDSVPGSDWP
jgi:DNA-binding GntR family transcriptional regulator